jgi:hypothetical protein
MIKNEESNESMRKKWHYCGWMCGGKRSGVFWGILLIAVGIFWIGKKANWFPTELIAMFWPGVLIFIGVWIVVAVLMRKGDRHLKE